MHILKFTVIILDHLRQVIPKLVKTFNKAWMIAKQHLVNNGMANIDGSIVAIVTAFV